MWGREPCERSHDLHLRAGVCGLKVTEQRTPPAHTHPARGTRRARSAVGVPGTAPRGRLIRPLARPLIVAGDHHAGPPRRPRSLSAALLDRLDRPGAEVPRCAPLAPPQPQEGHSSLSPNGRRIALSVAGARTAACVPAARAAMTASGSVATAAPAGASAIDLDAAEAQLARRRSGRCPPRLQQKERRACSRLLARGDDRHHGARSTATARAARCTRASGRRARWHGCARAGGRRRRGCCRRGSAVAAARATGRRRAAHTRARSHTHGDGTRGGAYSRVRAAGSVAYVICNAKVCMWVVMSRCGLEDPR